VPAAPFKGEAGKGNELLDPPSAGGAGGKRLVGKFLPGLEDDPAIVALIFVDRHDLYDLRSELRR
jgi:hypothetical protein